MNKKKKQESRREIGITQSIRNVDIYLQVNFSLLIPAVEI